MADLDTLRRTAEAAFEYQLTGTITTTEKPAVGWRQRLVAGCVHFAARVAYDIVGACRQLAGQLEYDAYSGLAMSLDRAIRIWNEAVKRLTRDSEATAAKVDSVAARLTAVEEANQALRALTGTQSRFIDSLLWELEKAKILPKVSRKK